MPPKPLSTTKLKRSHSELCFQRAFPRTAHQRRDAADALDQYENLVNRQPRARRSGLSDSGIAGSAVHYRFSFDVALWLARKVPGAVSIDWAKMGDTEALDELLCHILRPSEDEYFFSGEVTTRDWLAAARSGQIGTDFDGLMAQLQDEITRPFLRQLYDMADIPLIWDMRNDPYSRTRNAFPVGGISARTELRARPRQVRKEIQRPVDSITRLSNERGSKLIDVAMASLAARHRETYHFNFANPDEVYLAEVGEGIAIAIFGLLPAHRFALECTMGYLILSNGVPIAYGGASSLFKQVNTGINVFEEYRGSEASYLWVQVMRVYHSLIACTRFVASPYQLGHGNSEALRSGAFWFYYRLGYRPVDAALRRLASAERVKIKHDRNYRSDTKALRKLASCEMHLSLPGSGQGTFFDEKWLTTCSRLATGILAPAGGKTKKVSANRVASSLLLDVGIRSTNHSTKDEKSALTSLAPIVAALSPSNWSASEKNSLRKILRAKGNKYELPYARLMTKNGQLLLALRGACVRDRSSSSA